MTDFIVNSKKQFYVGDYFWSEINPFYRKHARFVGLIGSYKDVFVEDLEEFTVTNLCEFRILASGPPLYEVSDLSSDDSELLEEIVDDLLDLGYLEDSYSNWSSLVKPLYSINDEQDIRVYYNRLNEITDTFYSLPSISALLDSIPQSHIFSLIVLKDALHQLALTEESKEMTAFETDFGTFQFTTFRRGMKNANNCLQYTMDNVLEDIDEDSITYYQGQVLVHSSSYDEHLLTLKSVFSAFRCYNLKVGVEESLFLARKLVFLGKEISEMGVGISPDQLNKIKSFATPTSKRNVRSFLGLVGHYKNYVSNLKDLARPLRTLAHSNYSFYWGYNERKAFQTLKSRLVNARPIPLQ